MMCIAYISCFNSQQKSMPLNQIDDLALSPPLTKISNSLNIILKKV